MKKYTTKKEIQKWLYRNNITNYKINDDLSVDVCGDVNLTYKCNNNLPVIFKRVEGNFYVNNNQLSNLKGCPEYVSGNFRCNNNSLTSLLGCPQYVGGEFDARDNELENLEFCPKKIKKDLLCSKNKITTLFYLPDYIGGSLDCSYNPIHVNDLELSSIGEIKGKFVHYGSIIEDIKHLYNVYGYLKVDFTEIKAYLLEKTLSVKCDKIQSRNKL